MIPELLEKIGNKSVIILSTPRSGSTFLGGLISKNLNCDFFSEPSRPRNNKMKEFFFHQNLNKRFVLKEHTLMYMKNYINVFKDQEYCFIRLRRKNLFQQVLSSYISNERQNWFYVSTYFKNDSITLNEKKLLDTFEYIKKFNIASEVYKGKVDVDLFFEELRFDEDKTSQPTAKPDNYHDLVFWARNVLKDKL